MGYQTKKGITMKKINWLVVGIVVFLFLLLLFGGGMMSGWGYDNWGYGGWGMMGPGMMGWGFAPFGWIGMMFMWLIPIGFIALTVFGIIWLAQNAGKSTPATFQASCPNCGKGVQADWRNCPHCGTTLK